MLLNDYYKNLFRISMKNINLVKEPTPYGTMTIQNFLKVLKKEIPKEAMTEFKKGEQFCYNKDNVIVALFEYKNLTHDELRVKYRNKDIEVTMSIPSRNKSMSEFIESQSRIPMFEIDIKWDKKAEVPKKTKVELNFHPKTFSNQINNRYLSYNASHIHGILHFNVLGNNGESLDRIDGDNQGTTYSFIDEQDYDIILKEILGEKTEEYNKRVETEVF